MLKKLSAKLDFVSKLVQNHSCSKTFEERSGFDAYFLLSHWICVFFVSLRYCFVFIFLIFFYLIVAQGIHSVI